MWELDSKESWAPKNWCFWTVVLESLENPVDCKEIKPINPKGNQSWIFIGGTDAEAEAPILWPPDAKSLLIGKDPDAGKDWGQEKTKMTEGEMAGWHHWLNGHEFEQAPGDGKGQGGLACCSPSGHRVRQTQPSYWTTNIQIYNNKYTLPTSSQILRKFQVAWNTVPTPHKFSVNTWPGKVLPPL